jgi:hypothetical protein
VEALGDGVEPANSNDQDVPRMTWWPRQGSAEWVQFDFPQAKKVTGTSVYWFDDTGAGQCRVPASAQLLYKTDDGWKPVPGADAVGTKRNAWNQIRFPAIETTGLRLNTQLQPQFSGGILEWKVTE